MSHCLIALNHFYLVLCLQTLAFTNIAWLRKREISVYNAPLQRSITDYCVCECLFCRFSVK